MEDITQEVQDNLFEWHFTVRGPADSDFQHGIYHGRIILPVDYPMKPPSIIWLTPNGRFETNKKICLSISGHHPESWQPSWSIRTALLAIIGFMPTHPGGAIGSLDYTPDERKALAKKSKDWKCPTCGEVTGILLDVGANTQSTSDEAKELAAQINLQGEKPKNKEGECPIEEPRLEEIQPTSVTHTGTASESGAAQLQNATTAPLTDIQPDAQASSLPPPLPHPQLSSQFPQWPPFANPFSIPPVGFPFQYPGMSPLPSMAPMQFPYPPSHYPAAFPQYSWPSPSPGTMETPPGSYHHPQPISINNSASQANNSAVSGSLPNKKDQYSRTPMACPAVSQKSHPTTSNAPASTESRNKSPGEVEVDKEVKSNRGEMFKELLTKVNRVGSSTGNVEKNKFVVKSSSDKQETSAKVPLTPSKQRRSEHTREKHEEGTDSEISTKSQKKTGGKSVSEMGDTNADDNSESDIPPIEADASPGLEKGTCSSTSDLERWKQKYEMAKGVRQRQSATDSVSPDLTEGASAEPERSETNVTGQRIEAVVGDTGLRNRSRHGVRLGLNANGGNRPDNVVVNRQGSYDIGFFLMIGLFTTSMLILLNRLIAMDWSAI